jgi:xanthine dehydrogenase YagS FAD-binding subunit
MIPFEYAHPETETEALELLNDHGADTAVLAGGTDLVSLLNAELIAPKRVVDIKNVDSLQGIQRDNDGLLVGILTTLEEALDSPLMSEYRSVLDVIHATRAIQIQSMGTIGGDLCHLPNCWYFRDGDGLLAMNGRKSRVESGDNRYHAILGNRGPAKFVSASRFAPAMISWGAKVRVIGPEPDKEEWLPLEYFFVTPKTERQGISVLKPGQLISHIWLPSAVGMKSASYEVLQLQGLDWPLAGAAVTLRVEGGTVRDARITLGHVAPIPWVAESAARSLIGKRLDEESAAVAAEVAVSGATPLSENVYKVQIARTSVERALLRAVDKLEGGL